MRDNPPPALRAPVAAFLASFLVFALANTRLDIATGHVTFAALFMSLPGMALAVGVRELATGHLQAGMANTANAAMQLIGLVFGVAVGKSLAINWLGPAPIINPDPLPVGLQIVGAALIGVAFVVSLRARSRDWIWASSAAMFATAASLVAIRFFGDVGGIVMLALVVGLVGNAFGRRFQRSPLTFIVPGMLMIFPTSLGYESLTSLLAGETLAGISTAFDTFVAFLAIAYGLVASTVILPSNQTSPGGSPGT
jgi:uncharacterized membrane protein YjjB (DUF3815 family)